MERRRRHIGHDLWVGRGVLFRTSSLAPSAMVAPPRFRHLDSSGGNFPAVAGEANTKTVGPAAAAVSVDYMWLVRHRFNVMVGGAGYGHALWLPC